MKGKGRHQDLKLPFQRVEEGSDWKAWTAQVSTQITRSKWLCQSASWCVFRSTVSLEAGTEEYFAGFTGAWGFQ